MRLKVATVNIGRNIGAKAVRSDMRKVKRLGRVVVGWQEIDEADPADEHKILRQVFKNHHKAGFKTRVPITIPRAFEVKRRRVTHAAKGIPGASPTRVMTEALIIPKKTWWRKRLRPIVFLNLHYPAGAFNKKIEHNQKVREERWDDVYQTHKERVAYWADQRGYTVFWTGDVNRQSMPSVHPDERKLETGGIDKISVIPRTTNVAVKKKGRVKLQSDHDAKYVDVKLSQPKAKNRRRPAWWRKRANR